MTAADAALAIGGLRLTSRVFLAPMAGYTDLAFRTGIRRLGGLGLAYTEMLNPVSVLRGGGRKRAALLATDASDRPLGYQIYGAEGDLLSAAAQWLEAHGAALIDLNMGCPKRKIVHAGAGAALLREPEKAVRLAAQVVQAVRVPVTVKLRLGWDSERRVARDMAPALEQAGVAALVVHGRTRGQGYAGAADWSEIRRVVETVERIPVVGNGDVVSAAAARRMRLETGCAAVMVGRGVLTNPWLVRSIAANAVEASVAECPGLPGLAEFMREHFERMVGLYGPRAGVRLFRKWIPLYPRSLLTGRPEMVRLLQIADAEAMRRAMAELAIRLWPPDRP
jgi:nifR3 family TIM-barrel protein